MASIIEGFTYDIFISYRQKDNKGDKWVSEFVEALTTELESTFKEDVSVYFDVNPHDGLLEMHEVGDSLKEKLKCLVFIPILSQTYCDPRSFAWEHEFRAFVSEASQDQFGLKVRLAGGNVSSRVMPVRINDLDPEDIRLFEAVVGGPLRGIEFIYRTAGVNRPLRVKEDRPQENLKKTIYRDQINKVSRSIQEIIQGLKGGKTLPAGSRELQEEAPVVEKNTERAPGLRKAVKSPGKMWMAGMAAIFLVAALVMSYAKIFRTDQSGNLNSAEILEKAISVCDPFRNWDFFSAKVHLINIDNFGNIQADEIIEINNGEDYYKCSSNYLENWKEEKGITKGEVFKTVNDIPASSAELEKDSVVALGNIHWFREHHLSHFGFLMQIKESGLMLSSEVNHTIFQGQDCLALEFTCDTTLVRNDYFRNSDYTLYIDPENYTMKGSKYIWNGIDGFCVFTGQFKISNISIPMLKTYYNSADNSIMFIDVFTTAE